MSRVLMAVVVVLTVAAALAVNAMLVGLQTRPAVARSGGALMETAVVTANVKVEGEGPPIVLIHGIGAALDWWDAIAPGLSSDHRVIRLDPVSYTHLTLPTK